MTRPYPSHTQIQACHHDMPSCIIDDTIIHLQCPVCISKLDEVVGTGVNSRIDVEHVCDPTVKDSWWATFRPGILDGTTYNAT